ncbi:unnamed protein product [Prorocentrum cordatum]|uniref:Uncharacterized protein n=1 Tax=Prorocentrum cordatum TaxID=2364126 RepID=A0ABN9PDG1_9DINO|nr:unnamed protein product [Polarella glacialis]
MGCNSSASDCPAARAAACKASWSLAPHSRGSPPAIRPRVQQIAGESQWSDHGGRLLRPSAGDVRMAEWMMKPRGVLQSCVATADRTSAAKHEIVADVTSSTPMVLADAAAFAVMGFGGRCHILLASAVSWPSMRAGGVQNCAT